MRGIKMRVEKMRVEKMREKLRGAKWGLQNNSRRMRGENKEE